MRMGDRNLVSYRNDRVRSTIELEIQDSLFLVICSDVSRGYYRRQLFRLSEFPVVAFSHSIPNLSYRLLSTAVNKDSLELNKGYNCTCVTLIDKEF